MNPFVKFQEWFRGLPDKKQYIEVVTATLSIPVLLSVVFMNYLNIQEKRVTDADATPTQSPTVITIVRDQDEPTATPTEAVSITPTPTSSKQGECVRQIGPIEIRSPQENATISENPLEIDIEYDQGDYCSVVWSYRIDSGNWSDYSDDDILIYNLSSGKKTIELRVRSVVSNESTTLRRTFTYENTSAVPTATVTPSPTGTS